MVLRSLVPSFVERKPFNVLLYLVLSYFNRFGELYGHKKIQKLVFLLEYTCRGKTLIGRRGITGYTFTVWVYGPYPRELHRDLELLVDNGLVVEEVVGSDSTPEYRGIRLGLYDDDGYSKRIHVYRPSRLLKWLYRGRIRRSLSHIAEEIDYIVEEYGSKTPTELEEYVNTLLDLTPEKKIKYLGTSVDDYLKKENIIKVK